LRLRLVFALRAPRAQGELRPTEDGSLRRRLADGGGDVTEGPLKCLSLGQSKYMLAAWCSGLARGPGFGELRVFAFNSPKTSESKGGIYGYYP
jgi:hypothetical protein